MNISGNAGITRDMLVSALRDDEFILYHQPKVSLVSGYIVGSEALVRWHRNDGTVTPPDAFIPVAEQCGLLTEISVHLLTQSISAIRSIKAVHTDLSVSMNVTTQDLESHVISEQISSAIDTLQIHPSDLQIEITESIAMGNFDRVRSDLNALNELGIKVLMDDFGTGYSSIDRLSQLPFTALKLDKGVVQRMGTSRQNLNVVRSSISMARELRMLSVAEGVESEGAYNFLLANGCEEAQGYWIARPQKLSEFVEFVAGEPRYVGSQLGRVHQSLNNLMHYRKSLVDAAYCYRLSADTILESVVDPEVGLSAAESRFGTWYYGLGQELADTPGYLQIESHFTDFHQCGQQLMAQLRAGCSMRALDKLVLELDSGLAHLTSLIYGIERELLLTTPVNKAKRANQ